MPRRQPGPGPWNEQPHTIKSNKEEKIRVMMKKMPVGDDRKKFIITERGVSHLRQWINESVAKDDRLIENEDIIHFLGASKVGSRKSGKAKHLMDS